jgi:superfamily II DNA/RNA helicase
LPKKSFFSHSRPRGQVFKRGYGPQTSGRKRQGIDVNKFISEPIAQVDLPVVEIKHRFSDFDLPAALHSNLEAAGYQTPTPVQDGAIIPALEGRDVIGVANTGTGKTAAFLLPLIAKTVADRRQQTLIMAPTRELAQQIDAEFQRFSKGLNQYAALVVGGVNPQSQIAAIRRRPQFIVGTPGRLKDLIQRRQLDLSHFTNLVLDEVDRMVDIGFLKDIQFIVGQLPRQRQSLFL